MGEVIGAFTVPAFLAGIILVLIQIGAYAVTGSVLEVEIAKRIAAGLYVFFFIAIIALIVTELK